MEDQSIYVKRSQKDYTLSLKHQIVKEIELLMLPKRDMVFKPAQQL